MKYVGHGDQTLVDGQKGTSIFSGGEWQGYEGNDLGVDLKTFTQDTGGKSARFIKVHAVNPGVCPPWHEAAGQKCWIFADEIVVD